MKNSKLVINKEMKILFILYALILVIFIMFFINGKKQYANKLALCDNTAAILMELYEKDSYSINSYYDLMFPKVKNGEIIDLSVQDDLTIILMRFEEYEWYDLVTVLPENESKEISVLLTSLGGK